MKPKKTYGNLMRKIFFAIIAMATFPQSYSYANDSSIMLSAGGLIFQKNHDIAMLSEDLYISQENIFIDYIFENTSNKDITLTIAFPLPPYEDVDIGDKSFAPPQIDDESNDNFLYFKTLVDGKALSNKTLKKHREVKDIEGIDTIYINYYWQQVFPAKSKTRIQHQYTPVVGSEIPSTIDHIKRYITQEYCPDKNFNMALAEKAKEGYQATYSDIGYILTTGGNWAGGTIGDFRLVVDKGSPDSLVTFCGENVKKISPTQFEMRAKNYKPEKDIYVFIVQDWFKP